MLRCRDYHLFERLHLSEAVEEGWIGKEEDSIMILGVSLSNPPIAD